MGHSVGRVGGLILVFVFVVLFFEDIYIFAVAGVIPGIEFFVGIVLCILIWYLAIRLARTHRPLS
ncbi:hypothetical protein [Halegenticoccus tardaugens]|uniref:hypothetical protein n=1 Tax=Halegenticoccus tardaugens TaxID=2071624 RepID=UPI00100B0E16|nr:hypothetical protein [Halegenticoccus tardaugens]